MWDCSVSIKLRDASERVVVSVKHDQLSLACIDSGLVMLLGVLDGHLRASTLLDLDSTAWGKLRPQR